MQTQAMDALLAARELLANLTPLKTDCGRLCGAACCQPMTSEQGEPSGMYLFPGEERCYDSADANMRIVPTDWVLHGRNIPLLVCDGTCSRDQRPLACRLFPLIAREKDAGFDLRLDPRGWPVCPLMPHGLRALDPAFVAASHAAFALLWACPEHRAFLLALDQLLKQYETL